MPRKVRSGIIGLGNWGKNVARELDAASDLVAIATRSSSGHEAWLAEHLPGVRRTTSERIVEDDTIEAVAIVTPIPVLSKLAHTALSAGKHTFVEKPLAQSSEAAELLADLAAQRGLILAAGYVFLYHPVYLELKRRVQFQAVRAVKLEWRKFGTFVEPIEQSLLTHHLSLVLDLLGEPESGRISYGPGRYSECDMLETRLRYGTFDATSVINRASPGTAHRMTLDMSDGNSLIWEGNLLTVVDERGNPTVVYDDSRPPLAAEIARFVSAVAGGDPKLPTGGRFAAEVLRLLERIRAAK